ncbi:kinase-like domain-containing protein [Scheffersomyces coipomensis]|uniref:kinase-like domain-containing protein n=1 Tax=Scheffersomyces coipomensis TaxID=1788519 RepID=UPI00315C675C
MSSSSSNSLSQDINRNIDNLYADRSVTRVYGQDFIINKSFKVTKELGQGAYGIVCAAKYDDGSNNNDNNSGSNGGGSQVAIKKVTNIFSKKILCKRALREVKLLQFFRGHKNITCLYDLDVIPNPITGKFNEIYLYEELMECDMHQIIRSNQPLTDQHYQSFIHQILCGLKYIHSADVLHRDLKPSNILVNADCELKICDFGLARGYSENPEKNAGFLTEYVATRWYRAPEIMLCMTNYSKAIDVWSVGCILAEFLGRQPLFRGQNYIDQLLKILSVLGTPSEESLQKIGSIRAQEYVRGLEKMEKVKFAELFPNSNPEAIDLLEKMLTFDPYERITVDDALKHPYLSLWHDPQEEPECQVKFDFASFEQLDEEEDIKALMLEEVRNFREFVRKPLEEQQHIQLQTQIQQRQRQEEQEAQAESAHQQQIRYEQHQQQLQHQQQQLQQSQQTPVEQQQYQQYQQFQQFQQPPYNLSGSPISAKQQYDSLNSSTTAHSILQSNIPVNTSPQFSSNSDYPSIPKPQELDDFTYSNLNQNSYQVYQQSQQLTSLSPNSVDYMRLEEELGFGLDGNFDSNFNDNFQ